jgi:hypothetical protein
MIACTVLRPKCYYPPWLCLVPPSCRLWSVQPVTAIAANANNNACVVQRILEAIDLLEGTTVEANTLVTMLLQSLLRIYRRAIAIALVDRMMLRTTSKVKQQWRLEEDGNDDDTITSSTRNIRTRYCYVQRWKRNCRHVSVRIFTSY